VTKKAKLLVALLSAIAEDGVHPKLRPPDEYSPDHGKFCNVNLFKDGKCDCKGAS
jgi:hypothetical protein